MKPIIAMTVRDNTADNNRTLQNNDSYYEYILAAGGLPADVYAKTAADAEEIAKRFDGLLITGGADIDPERYDEPNKGSYLTSEDVEQSDFLLYEAFKALHKPILGICRGEQVIAVAEGAKLIQHIPDAYPGAEHNQRNMVPPIERDRFCHSCTFLNGRIRDIFTDDPSGEYPVNSFHHQAALTVPEGFTLSAVSSKDNIIEAFERGNITAVQWHPERLIKDPRHLQIAVMFVNDCKQSV